jgi:peptidoglycan/xylan/chitin deacetylase (PgdA/CDA1 family)
MLYLALLLTFVLTACGSPANADPTRSDVVVAARAPGAVEVASAAALVDDPAGMVENTSQQPDEVWVANYVQTILWDGAGEDAQAIGRLPVGSYFRLTGDGVAGRLPVSYLGNRTVAATEAWIAASDVGPIPEPGADWSEPDFPPRRLQVGERDELIRGDPSLPLIALTFDAGADVGTTAQLLDVLRDKGVHSTFFIAGAYADRYPGMIARMANEGHELANHSYSHPDFRNLSEAQMRTEIRRGTAAIETAAGTRIVPLWRPPFGSRNSQILRVVAEEGFRSVFWTYDSGDWIVGATQAGITNNDLNRAVAGAVVVHHVSPSITARAMPTIIDELRRRGYQLVTVSELIGP